MKPLSSSSSKMATAAAVVSGSSSSGGGTVRAAAMSTKTTNNLAQRFGFGLDTKGRPRAIFLYDGGCGVWKFSVGFVVDRDRTDHFRFSPLQTKYAHQLCQVYGMPADLTTGILIEPSCEPTTTTYTPNNTKQPSTGTSSTTTGIHQDEEDDNDDRSLLPPPGRAYRDSTAILRMLLYLTFPYNVLGFVALYLVPKFFRDACYRAFARNRGTIWKTVKKMTGLGDTIMDPYRNQILGIHQTTMEKKKEKTSITNNDDDNENDDEDSLDRIIKEKPGWGFTEVSMNNNANTNGQGQAKNLDGGNKNNKDE